jgi:hypothetical protein
MVGDHMGIPRTVVFFGAARIAFSPPSVSASLGANQPRERCEDWRSPDPTKQPNPPSSPLQDRRRSPAPTDCIRAPERVRLEAVPYREHPRGTPSQRLRRRGAPIGRSRRLGIAACDQHGHGPEPVRTRAPTPVGELPGPAREAIDDREIECRGREVWSQPASPGLGCAARSCPSVRWPVLVRHSRLRCASKIHPRAVDCGHKPRRWSAAVRAITTYGNPHNQANCISTTSHSSRPKRKDRFHIRGQN